MSIEIRTGAADEARALHEVLGVAFGEGLTDEQHDDEMTWFEPDRSVAAVEDGSFVGAAGAYTFDLTLPGATTIPVAGVTWVGVLPTHRRRGILSRMMAHQLDDVVAREEPVAVLTASEGTIYGRYGYGVANSWRRAEIDTRRSAFVSDPAPAPGSRIRMLTRDEATKVLPGVYDTYRRAQPGAISRNAGYWDRYFRDRESWRDGASGRFYAIHESPSGAADGYTAYRVKETWTPAAPTNLLLAMDVVTADPEVEAALWRFLLDIDLIGTCRCWNRPLDDRLEWRLVDWRAYAVTEVADWLWVRVLDVPAALSARRYRIDGSVVVEVVDPFRPANDGRYRLVGGPDGAECTRTEDDADLALGIAELGSIYLGGVVTSTLARAGRVQELTDGAAATADAMFASHPLPHCITGF